MKSKLHAINTEENKKLSFSACQLDNGKYILFGHGKKSCMITDVHYELIKNNPQIEEIPKQLRRWLLEEKQQKPLDNTLKNGTLYLEITGKCNLKCSFCIASPSKGNHSLGLGCIRQIIDSAKQLGVHTIILSGGEATLHKDIVSIVDCLIEKKIGIVIKTNGTVWNSAIEILLEKYGNIILWDISLDGWDEKSFDAVRGKGSYKLLEKTITAFYDHQAKLNLCSSIILPENVGQQEEIVEKAIQFGFKHISFAFLLEDTDSQWITQEKKGEVLISIYELVKKYKSRIAVTSEIVGGILGCLLYSGESMNYSCSAGNFIKVDSLGNIFPCPYFSNFNMGNIKDKPLHQLVEEKSLLQDIKEKVINRLDSIEECKFCGWKFNCGGGCMAKSYNKHDSLDKNDEDCESKNIFYNHVLHDIITK